MLAWAAVVTTLCETTARRSCSCSRPEVLRWLLLVLAASVGFAFSLVSSLQNPHSLAFSPDSVHVAAVVVCSPVLALLAACIGNYWLHMQVLLWIRRHIEESRPFHCSL